MHVVLELNESEFRVKPSSSYRITSIPIATSTSTSKFTTLFLPFPSFKSLAITTMDTLLIDLPGEQRSHDGMGMEMEMMIGMGWDGDGDGDGD